VILEASPRRHVGTSNGKRKRDSWATYREMLRDVKAGLRYGTWRNERPGVARVTYVYYVRPKWYQCKCRGQIRTVTIIYDYTRYAATKDQYPLGVRTAWIKSRSY
jgi:hypothetical protein